MSNTEQFWRGSFPKLSVLAAQLSGTFPLSLDENSSGYFCSFSWLNFGMLAMTFRTLLATFYFCTSMIDMAESLLAEWSKTMILFEMVTHIVITVCDICTGILWIVNKNKYNTLLLSLHNFFTDMRQSSSGNQQTNILQIQKAFLLKYRVLKWSIYGIIFSAFQGLVLIWMNTLNVRGPLTLDTAIQDTFYTFTLNFRLLGFFPVISLIFMFQFGFALLKCHVLESPVAVVVKNFTKLEQLLADFHTLFAFQLASGMATILASMLDMGFNLIVEIMLLNFSLEDIWYSLSLESWIVSLLITFYLLCDIPTGLSRASMECLWEFRKCSNLNGMDSDEKKTFMQFYIEKATRPPKVSPAALFTLGRELFPTVS